MVIDFNIRDSNFKSEAHMHKSTAFSLIFCLNKQSFLYVCGKCADLSRHNFLHVF